MTGPARSATIRLPSNTTVNVPTGLFINNEFVAARRGQVIESINPANEDVICTISAATEEDVDLAVAAARAAFRTSWGNNILGSERARLLYKLADLMERDQDLLAELESLDNGKPVRIARDADIADSILCLRYYAGWADKITGETIATNGTEKFSFTRSEPIGVCGQIIPWNYPIQMWAWKVAPALAVGCTIVIKPSELTSLTALKLCELVVESGFPPGVLNCIPSLGSVGGAALTAHDGVDKIAFTGSTATGRSILKASAESNLKKVTLELGGKSPSIVFDSADIEQAVDWCLSGGLFNTGQDCTCSSRIYVQAAVYDAFMVTLGERIRLYRTGPGFDEKCSAGPLISKTHFERVWAFVDEGVASGATLAIGGQRHAGPGYFMDPVVFTDVKPSMRIVQEEIFGPVLCVGKFETEAEAIELANGTRYGLGAALHSRDAGQCMRVLAAIDAGTVWVNEYGLLRNNVPFGGVKQSGIGRELGRAALDEYLNVKAVHWSTSTTTGWPL